MKYFFIFIIGILSTSTYADSYYIFNNKNQPYDYSINAKDPIKSSSEGFNSGFSMAKSAQISRQEREERQAKIKRQDEYRNDLKKAYEDYKSHDDDSFQKLIIAYPEYADTTLKVQESITNLKGKNK